MTPKPTDWPTWPFTRITEKVSAIQLRGSSVIDKRERAAIAATMSDNGLLDRVRAVAGSAVGDPLNNPHDSVKLREQFDLTVEFTHSTVYAFNDDVCATLKTTAPDAQAWARRAACVAVASMWTPEIGKAARAARA